MARPTKVGLDYFPLDVNISNDDKIQLIEAEFGLKGFAVIVKLFIKIYSEKGYFYEWKDKERILFAKMSGESGGLVDEIVKRSVKWGLFDESVFNKFQVLTSEAIQKRYVEAILRRDKVEFIKEYLLININDYKNRINVDINSVNANIGTQSKVKNNTTKCIYLFVSIKNLNEYFKNFEGNKTYFLIAYRFWELWSSENPNHGHLKKANVYDWVDTIRLIIERDNQTIDRLVAVMEYFRKCQEQDKRFKDFWYKTIKSINALRNADKNGVRYLDLIANEVNEMTFKMPEFGRLIKERITKIKNHESIKLSA
jgi:hypothetical protein